MRKLQIGLFVDQSQIPAWAFHMLSAVISKDLADFALLIKMEKKKGGATSSHQPSPFVYSLFEKFENKFFKPRPDAFEKRTLASLNFEGTPVMEIACVESALGCSLSDNDLAKVEAYRLDVLIYLGAQTLTGKILSIPKFGVWAYCHAGDLLSRDLPPGFMEVMKNKRETGSLLYIVADKTEDCKILKRSWASTDRISVNRNRNKYFWKSASFIPEKLEELYRFGGDRFMQHVEAENSTIALPAGKRIKLPGNLGVIQLLSRHGYKWIKSKLLKTFYYNQWIMLYSIGNDRGAAISSKSYTKMLPPADRFWADPFVLEYNNKFLIFLEEGIYKEHNGRAHISLIEMDKDGKYGSPVVILKRPYHLSYPNVFRYEGNFYMIPESMDNGTIEIYKATNFPYQWEFCMNLMENVKAVDTTILHKDGKYWMFANIRQFEGASESDELFIFYADTLLTNNWQPHKKNPVISDVKSARPAGNFFMRNDKLYRPSQDCSWRYGYATNINEVVELTDEIYVEKVVSYIGPGWEKGIVGTHTINSDGGLTVIDAIFQKRKF